MIYTGPYAQRAGHDVNYMALSGILGSPNALPYYQAADASGAMNAVIGILAAVVERTSTNEGNLLFCRPILCWVIHNTLHRTVR